MARRAQRVSEAQFNILLEFVERNPNLARARGYNNSAQGRALSSRLWMEVAEALNAEGSGTTKTPKEWSVYVSNYKSRLKRIVADIKADANATDGGPPQSSALSDVEQRFLSLMGHRFEKERKKEKHLFGTRTGNINKRLGQSGSPLVSVNPLEMDLKQSTPPGMPQGLHVGAEEVEQVVTEMEEDMLYTDSRCRSASNVEPTSGNTAARSTSRADTSKPLTNQAGTSVPSCRPRQTRYRSRPLAPLDEARRILSQVEMQRAAADSASARALHMMAQNIGRLADAAERYLSQNGYN